MKNKKDFDYDKQIPSVKQYIIDQNEKELLNDDYEEMFNEPPLIKGFDIKQNNQKKIQQPISNRSLKKQNAKSQKLKLKNQNITIDKKEQQKKIETDNLSAQIPIEDKNSYIENPQTENILNSDFPPIENNSDMSDSEILLPDLPLDENKEPSINFCKNYITNLLNPIKYEIDPIILSGVESGLNKVMITVQDAIEDDRLEINEERRDVNEIKKNNISLIPKNPTVNYESAIKMQKIRELSQRKKSLEKQINKLDENIRIIDDEKSFNPSNTFSNPTSLIDENIKKDQLKENKQAKEILLSKLNTINEQVQRLMENEEELANAKKLNIKDFLENFERDKEKATELAKKYDEEKKIREQKMMNSMIKSSERRQKEYEALLIEEEEKKKKELEKIRLRELERIRGRTRENLEKLNYIRQHVNDKPANENEYLFKVLENKYKEKTDQEIQLEILKHKQKQKESCVSLDQIYDFEKKQKSLEMKRLAEVEEEKKKLREQWKQTKDILPKFEPSVMQIVKEEENKLREQKEIEEFKKKIKQKEIKNYCEVVQKMFLPKINESVKKEREDRIKNLTTKNNIQKLQKKKNNGRILLVKPDPNKPRKYGWKLKLEDPDEKNDDKNKNTKKVRSHSAYKKEPMEKLPDYLTEMRLQKKMKKNNSQSKMIGNDWDKMLKSTKGSLYENVEKVKQKAEELENKAKMDEKLIQNGDVNADLHQKVSGYLIDAIKAKISILENINQNNAKEQ